MTPRLLLLSLFLAACGQQPPPTPTLMTLPFRPMLPELQALAQRLPAPPTAAEQKEMAELLDLALHPGSADERTAMRAERALLEHPKALIVLEPALADADAGVRARAAWLCGHLPTAEAVFALLFRLKYELEPANVAWLAEALHRVGNDAALLDLDAAIDRPETAELAGRLAVDVCRSGGVELPEAPTWEQVRQGLRQLDRRWHQTGTGSIAKPPSASEATAARAAAHLCVTEGTALRPVDEARYVLTRTGTLCLPQLRLALQASEPYLRTMALQVLAEVGPAAKDAASGALPLLGDPLCAAYAMRALAEMGEVAALPHLRTALGNPDLDLRAAAASALGVLGDQASAPQLDLLLADANEALDVRVMAAFGRLLLGEAPAAKAFLAEREQKQDFHLGTLRLLQERLRRAGR